MKAFVNYPVTDNLKKELSKKVSLFHALLVIEAIKRLDYTNEVKSKILNLILKELKDA
ncbi:MAG: hypothetical protein U0M66_00440 [Bacilli bacterium]|nr:hypothetical protein [Bacilli bacterium]